MDNPKGMEAKTLEDVETAVAVVVKEMVAADKKSRRHKTRGQTLVEAGVDAVVVEIAEITKVQEVEVDSLVGEVADQVEETKLVEHMEMEAIVEDSVEVGEAEEVADVEVAVIAATVAVIVVIVAATVEDKANQELRSDQPWCTATDQVAA